ncbi:MAG TPA: SatD family protein [Candidatus Thermoplasmatota archaeon]
MVSGKKAELVTVLIGDLSRSRDAPDRATLQQVFAHELIVANQDFGRHLISRLCITVGDEYQGVFDRPEAAFRAALQIAEALYPMQLHHGIGIGTIATAIDRDYPGRMDGPAFHHARAALEQGRRQKAMFTFSGLDPSTDELLAATASLWQDIRGSRTQRQREVIDTVEKSRDQKAAAARLDVTPQSVADVLQAARYHELNRLKAALVAFLNNHPKMQETPK